MAKHSSWWSQVEMGRPDPVLGLNEAFNRDKNPRKVNVGVGIYRDDAGKAFILPCVIEAEKRMAAKNLNKDSVPSGGTVKFCTQCITLALGDESEHVRNGLTATVQGVSGTGSLRLGAEFLKKYFPGNKVVYVPAPTWANHVSIFNSADIAIDYYRYLNPSTFSFDLTGALEDMSLIPERSIILFHACAHNPSGSDPTQEQWVELSRMVKQRNLFAFFDMAYQGLASGDLNKDAYAVRHFVKEGHCIALAQSFSANMGLYGERAGSLTFVCSTREERERVLSQLKALIRPFYSNPPIHGAQIVVEILSDPKLRSKWLEDLSTMCIRIMAMRNKLLDLLKKKGSSRNWSHALNQVGLYFFSGLTDAQVQRMIKEFSIYLTRDGRICIAALSINNIDYVAKCIYTVTK